MSWRDYISQVQGRETVQPRLREWKPPRRQPSLAPGVQLYEANAELKLAAPPYEPLAEHKLNGADPLQSFAEIFGGLRDENQEKASVCVDLRAVPNARARRLRSYWLAQAPGGVTKGTLAEPETHGMPIGYVVTRSQDRQRLSEKLNPQEVLFEVQILIHTESTDEARPAEILRAFLTAFQQWKGPNELSVHGNLISLAGKDLKFIGADGIRPLGIDLFRVRRWWFKLRLTTGLFWPAEPALLTAWELAGLLKPWTLHNRSSAPIRSGGTVAPAPVALPDYDLQGKPPAATSEDEEAV